MKSFDFLTASEQPVGLAWGLHGPFRDYIARMSDGRLETHDGAVALSAQETYFPLDTATETALHFRGRLQFLGHRGMLAVSVEDPWLQVADESVVLTILDPFDPTTRMPLTVVDLRPDGTGATRLTEAGTDLFMGNYPEHTDFDPVRILWAEKEERYDHVK